MVIHTDVSKGNDIDLCVHTIWNWQYQIVCDNLGDLSLRS